MEDSPRSPISPSPPLTVMDIVSFNVEQLAQKLLELGEDPTNLSETQMRQRLVEELKLVSSQKSSPMLSPKSPRTPMPRRESFALAAPYGKERQDRAGSATSSENLEHIEFRKWELEMKMKQMELDRRLSHEMERERLAREERDSERERLERKEREEREREERRERDGREHELALKRLEVEANHASSPRGSGRNSSAGEYDVRTLSAAARLLPKFDEGDVEGYLNSFERIVAIHAFPREKWSALLHTQLVGKALKVFGELSISECNDYDLLKAAILKAYALVPDAYRKRFRSLTKFPNETFSNFAFRLNIPFMRWIESADAMDVARLKELMQLEQFCTILSKDLKSWLIDKKPITLMEAAKLADEYTITHIHSESAKHLPESHVLATSAPKSGPLGKPNDGFKARSFNKPTTEGFSTHKMICTYCKGVNHTISNCYKLRAKRTRDRPGDSRSSNLERNPVDIQLVNTLDPVPSSGIDPAYRAHCSVGQLFNWLPSNSSKSWCRDVVCLRDTGALQSLVTKQFVSESEYVDTGETRLLRGIRGQAFSVPLVEINLKSKFSDGRILVGLIDTLPEGVQVLIGNDLVPADPMINSDLLVVTRSQDKRDPSHEDQPTELDLSVPGSNVPVDDQCDDSDEVDLNDLFNSDERSDVSRITRNDLIRLQNTDQTLPNLFELVVENPEVETRKSFYFLRDGVLMRKWFPKHDPRLFTVGISQIVVPVTLREKLLVLAHDIPMSGHLGVKKTLDRLLNSFFWPKIHQDVSLYIRSCETCQKLDKRGIHEIAPLVEVPVVGETWQRIAIDIVGPLPECTTTGNRFILTILDLCSHYPEAIPLLRHDARSVATALISVFSRFGFPNEILSDQGTEFLSDIMQIFLDECNISHIKCSIYHPQSNPVERFHRVLKQMIRSIPEVCPQAWDTCLPWILFAYREVPVEGLGFSPFELMFGRTVSGPLSLIKNFWMENDILPVVKKKAVVEFVLELRERIREALSIVSERALNVKRKAKGQYDKKSCVRNIEEGQQVLVWLPMDGKPLQMRFHGPYKVLKKLGPVNFLIETPDRRRNTRVCHMNLLKVFVPRTQVAEDINVATIETVVEVKPPVFADTYWCGALETEQRKALTAVLDEFKSVFSNQPGRTTAISHQINLQPNVQPIYSPPFRLSPEKSAFVKEEIENLLKSGIIEPSDSPWASPVVVVKKSNGEFRLCTDLRKVNAVTVPDPFPMPREMI
jgi:hypothetical protein